MILFFHRLHIYRSVPGKRPLPNKRPCTAFQGVNVAASIQTYGKYVPGKCPCGPKSRCMFKRPWALTQDTTVVKSTINNFTTHAFIGSVDSCVWFTDLGIPLFMRCHILEEELHDGIEHKLSEYSVLIGFTQHHIRTPGQRVKIQSFPWWYQFNTHPSFTSQRTTLGEVKGSPADNLNAIKHFALIWDARKCPQPLTERVPSQL